MTIQKENKQMKKTSIAKRLSFVILLVIFAASSFFVITQSSVAGQASGDDICHIQLAEDFISFQHRIRDNQYDNIKVYTSVNLYDYEHNVVGSAVIIYRDGEYDYVVFNLITRQIDEWGFNEPEVTANFKSGERIYYTGPLNFSVRDGLEYVGFNGARLGRERFRRTSREFRENSRSRSEQDGGELTTRGGGSFNDGILTWSEIMGIHHSHLTIDAGYLPGIGRGGITGNGLSFVNQNVLNVMHFIRHMTTQPRGTCGPTAVVNMLIYFQWRGFNVLINGCMHDTFDSVLVTSGWTPNGGTVMSGMRNSARATIRGQGYNYTVQNLGGSFAGFRDSIRNGRPAMMGISHNDGGSHAVVVVGFEHFRIGLSGANFHYLRVIDGWATSNAGRFVDFNGFFHSIDGASFWVT